MPRNEETKQLIERALAEDAAFDDRTTRATVPEGAEGGAVIVAKADGVVSGTRIAEAVFARLDPGLSQRWQVADGRMVRAGDVIAELEGRLAALLAAERTALNFLQHLSGIATATRRFVDAVAGTGCRIADTRKTVPGLRHLAKQAVRDGGGVNHRADLAEGMLIKENHIAAAGSITEAVRRCRTLSDKLWIEVECETLAEVEEAVAAAPDMILLDNMPPAMVREARRLVPGTIVLEASGNITLENARTYAETGVDRLAVGAITHSAGALDLSMRVLPL
ncbi:MAG: carboxylating nicotinate-nucleotide diphosphorylase [Deltaproteobacteria bacterium]|nr:MAG: carboxylating nicotinate-nucleotide diphosphorylase [Deltaproteobacteria bacterium]